MNIGGNISAGMRTWIVVVWAYMKSYGDVWLRSARHMIAAGEKGDRPHESSDLNEFVTEVCFPVRKK